MVSAFLGLMASRRSLNFSMMDMCLLRRTCGASLGGHVRAGHPNEGELEWANGRVSPEPKQLRVGWLLAVGCWLMVAGCWLIYMRVILFLQGASQQG